MEKGVDFLTCEAYEHYATFTEDSRFAKTDLGTVEMSGEAYFKDGQLFVPVDESAKCLKWRGTMPNATTT